MITWCSGTAVRRFWSVVAIAIWCALPAAPAEALPSECLQSGPTVTCSYTAAGSHTFTVPDDVISLQVIAAGAPGGANFYDLGAAPGWGASVEDPAVPVVGGQSLMVWVASRGAKAAPRAGGAGGFPGGGNGADGTYNAGGGGGGYSAVLGADAAPLVVAAGGGGQGAHYGGSGGHGDTGSGSGGSGGTSTQGGGGGGGGGGTQSAGGTAGGGALPGSYLTGGAGGAGQGGGGGGGAGYYGGGGGGAGGIQGGGGVAARLQCVRRADERAVGVLGVGDDQVHERDDCDAWVIGQPVGQRPIGHLHGDRETRVAQRNTDWQRHLQ